MAGILVISQLEKYLASDVAKDFQRFKIDFYCDRFDIDSFTAAPCYTRGILLRRGSAGKHGTGVEYKTRSTD